MQPLTAAVGLLTVQGNNVRFVENIADEETDVSFGLPASVTVYMTALLEGIKVTLLDFIQI